MDSALLDALRLIATADGELLAIVGNSIVFSLTSTAICALVGVPIGVLLVFGRFRGRRGIVAAMHTLMSLPTVVVGLLVYSALSRSGPLGSLGLLFTPAAIVAGQAVLAFPIVTSLVYGAVATVDDSLRETLLTLGSSPPRVVWKTLLEARVGIATAVLSGFGRVVGEVGVSMMLGGNIRGYTRTMTTALALETQRGAFSFALSLGIVLLVLALSVNLMLNLLVHRGAR